MPSILIAEDEQRIASFIEKGLSAAGFGATTVADGRSALEAALSGGYDLLLLDLGLPSLDGLDVLKRLREQGSRMPVIILTARDSAVDTVAGFEGLCREAVPLR
jgi:two-component system copper resistance phosphate regulon response regulator CusR